MSFKVYIGLLALVALIIGGLSLVKLIFVR
jgi:hypothetical protein